MNSAATRIFSYSQIKYSSIANTTTDTIYTWTLSAADISDTNASFGSLLFIVELIANYSTSNFTTNQSTIYNSTDITIYYTFDIHTDVSSIILSGIILDTNAEFDPNYLFVYYPNAAGNLTPIYNGIMLPYSTYLIGLNSILANTISSKI